MSTKQLVLQHDDFEVYHDYLDDGFVWLELRRAEFEATRNEVRAKIPVAVWEILRRAPGAEFDMLEATDEQIAAHVQEAVDERLRDDAEERASGGSCRAGLVRVLMFGHKEDSREQHIERGIEYYSALREQQRRIAAEVAELEAQMRFMCPQGSIYTWLVTGAGARNEAVELCGIAARVFGQRESVSRWMITPALALDGARPGDLLTTPAGRTRVRELLAQLEHGVYA